MVNEYQECVLCLEMSKGEVHTEVKWIGPLKDVHVCQTCDFLPLPAA